MGDEEREFEIEIDRGAWVAVRKRRDPAKGLDWAAVLCVERGGRRRNVCIYDNAYGSPERHRVRQGVKQAGEPVPTRGAARLDLPAAIEEIKESWGGMVERWEP
jgi:hypothetical protein